ncbi:hypothetical protein BGW38_008004 [Lunasporangiospora selenospora]|uniref:Tail specific protease domain-containing protein n=1 Tax=Lunasporangiospora selenospora TaxID=979761 RepID=A0A9P6KGN9_9FUNG|nr:hypothetical protein BGW38_008004 [Lunasporangiospora selenospora]
MKFSSFLSLAVAVGIVAAQNTPTSSFAQVSDIDVPESAILAAAPSNAAEKKKPPKGRPLDACGLMAREGKTKGSFNFASVKGCYEAHPYKRTIAHQVIDSVESIVGNFYAFVDQAKDAAPGKGPFKTDQVDVVGGLRKLRAKKNWKNDFEFQTAVSHLTYSVNDGHFAYRNGCYQTAIFSQPITLYAPVVNGKQEIRVFYADTKDRNLPKDISLVDCVVTTIDGKPAIQSIQEHADRTSAVSKDPGVRLNDALASTSWYEEWAVHPGGFARRWELPSKATVDYTIQCPKRTLKLSIPWTVLPSDTFDYDGFKDVKSYWEYHCETSTTSYDNSAARRRNDGRNSTLPVIYNSVARDGASLAPATEFFRRRGTLPVPSANPTNGRDPKSKKGPATISQAREVLATSTTAFYRMTAKGLTDTCVAVIATEETQNYNNDDIDYTDFLRGLQLLQDGGCKKLILDMTNNGGGSVDFAYFVNQAFFPKTKPFFEQDMRSNSLVQTAARLASKGRRMPAIFDARGFINAKTGKAYKDSSLYTKGVQQRRGGSTVTFSQRNYFPHSWSILPLSKSKALRWKPQDMAIVTNGFCGSACSMIATRFRVMHKVRTYAVGGISKRPLSYFSFPGGFVLDGDSILGDLHSIGFKGDGKTRLTSLPVQASVSIAVGEVYANDKTNTPLEYDQQHFAADIQLDQDMVSARHPDRFWVRIASDLKKK